MSARRMQSSERMWARCLFFACMALAGAASGAPTASVATVPLFFESAQSNSFLARGQNYQFLIAPTEASVVLRKVKGSAPSASGLQDTRASRQLFTRVARMRFLDANAGARISGQSALSGKINYLLGNDPAQWRTGLQTYSQVSVENVYPGVDLLYHGNQQLLQYDFTIAPGADPGAISIRFDGVNRLKLSPAGELIVGLGQDEIRQPSPEIYQVSGGVRRPVTGGYRLKGPRTVQFAVGAYDHALPLIIDPTLSYSSYFGGNFGDLALGVKVDPNGFIYLAGETVSTTFPFPLPPGGFSAAFQGGRINGDAFIAKFDNSAANLIYFTYLGGSGNDGALDLAVDASGHAFVTGFTDSTNFPTSHALFPAIGGKRNRSLGVFPTDAFVAELTPDGGGLVYSTYLGGGLADSGVGIALEPAGAAWITGYTYSSNFPVTASAFQFNIRGSNDVFVAKIAPGGTALAYSSYLGGTNIDEGQGIAVDPGGIAYVTGYTISTNFPVTPNALQPQINHSTNAAKEYRQRKVPMDAFLARFDPAQSGPASLTYCTLFGGTNSDAGFRIALDQNTNAYVTGNSSSGDFPNTNHQASIAFGANSTNKVNSDAFLFRFNFGSGGPALDYSILFGGKTNETGWGVAVDPVGNAYVVGITAATNFPVTNTSGFLRATNSGKTDVFVTAFNTNASAVLYSAYLGGSHNDFGYAIAVDATGTAYVAGQTQSTNFPVVSPFQSTRTGTNDAFLVRIQGGPVPPQAPLSLRATRVGGELELSWPAFAPSFRVEESSDLATWTPLQATNAITTNGTIVFRVATTNGARFFRLRK